MMFIIFGSPRSGTTLLASTMDSNDSVLIPRETDFIVPTAFVVDRVKDQKVGKKLIAELITSAEGLANSIGEYLSERDVKKIVSRSEYSLTGIVSQLYEAIADKERAKIAGDKSPNDLNFLRILVKTGLVDSDVKVIHIIRDIRDVVLSLKKVSWAPRDIETRFPRLWNYSNLYLRGLYAPRPEKYLLIKYEDMVMNPAEIFQKITDFLGVRFQDKMFDHNRRGTRYSCHADHTNIARPFLADRVDA